MATDPLGAALPPLTLPPVSAAPTAPAEAPAPDAPEVVAPPTDLPDPPRAPQRQAYVVAARLESGERIEIAAHPDADAARAEATALMRYLRESRGDWPYLGNRFVRPEAIVSVDVEPA